MEKSIETFDFSGFDTSKLLKRNGKEEKAKTEENAKAKAEENAKAEETSKELEEKKAEVETLKKEVAKKEEQLNKKAIAEFNDDALLSIADCIEVLIKKHCPIPSDFDFSAFETDLFKAIENKWDLKSIEK
jgi:molecular chaperone GrpE (heat shock protein)